MEIDAIYHSCCQLLFRLEFLKNSIGILAKCRPEKLKERHQIEVADGTVFFNFSNQNFAGGIIILYEFQLEK